MRAAYITHADCLKHEMGEWHPECPRRITAIEDRLIARGLLDLFDRFDAPEASAEELGRVHDANYLAQLSAIAPHEGYAEIDPDTFMNPATLSAARHAAGAAALAARLVVQDGYTRAFCNVRPPGHHAERRRAMGFCFYNNAAVAIAQARALGIERVALVDFDVHHGNGSEDIWRDDPSVLMISTYQSGIFPFPVAETAAENMHNRGLPRYSRGDALREVVESHWLPAIDRFDPQLLVLSAGFDAHRDDDLGQLGWVEQDYAWLSEQLVGVADRHCGGRVVSVLEGGYNLDALARSVEQHVRALLDVH